MTIHTLGIVPLRRNLVARIVSAGGRPWVELVLHRTVALRVWAQGWP